MVERGETVVRETRGWDARRSATYFMRAKEAVSDYRYMDEPDLPAIRLSDDEIEVHRAGLPQLPAEREDRYVTELGLGREIAATLCESLDVTDYFESVAERLGDAHLAANWVSGEGLRLCGEAGVGLDACPVPPEAAADLLAHVVAGALSLTAAKTVIAVRAAEGLDAATAIARAGLDQLTDRDVLAETVRRVVSDHPDQAAAYRDGKLGVADWLVGRVMAETGGRADPVLCAELVRAALAAPPDTDTK